MCCSQAMAVGTPDFAFGNFIENCRPCLPRDMVPHPFFERAPPDAHVGDIAADISLAISSVVLAPIHLSAHFALRVSQPRGLVLEGERFSFLIQAAKGTGGHKRNLPVKKEEGEFALDGPRSHPPRLRVEGLIGVDLVTRLMVRAGRSLRRSRRRAGRPTAARGRSSTEQERACR